jgi:CheY-like chemotaxis protein
MTQPNQDLDPARRRARRRGARRRCRVALAEDDRDTRALLAMSLRESGCEVAEASSGTALLEHLSVLLARGPEKLPDLILTDVAMPDCTGLDVLTWLRTLDHPPPCVVVTGYGTDEVRLLAAESGAAAFLEKPIDLDALDRLVRLLANVDR